MSEPTGTATTPLDAPATAGEPPTEPTPHPWAGVCVSALLPALIVVDTLVALARGWQLQPRLDRIVFFAAVGAVAALVAVACLPAGRRFFGRNWSRLLPAVLVTAVAWTTAEVVLAARQRRIDAATYHRRPLNLRLVSHPDPTFVPGVSGPSRYSTNSLGVRGSEFPPRAEAYRILCIGGSTTECRLLDDEETWTHLVGANLNRSGGGRRFWSGSVGIAGFASIEHLAFVERSDLMAEIDCLVFLVGINEVAAAGVGLVDWHCEPAAPLWTRSGLLHGFRNLRRYRILVPENPDGGFMELHRRRRREGVICDEMPDLEAPLAAYAARIQRIIGLCRDKAVRPVFLTQPVLFDENLSPEHRRLCWTGELKDGRFLSDKRMREAVERFNGTLSAVCRELGVECIDLSSMHGRIEFFYDHCHFTEAGAAEVARIVTAHFLNRP